MFNVYLVLMSFLAKFTYRSTNAMAKDKALKKYVLAEQEEMVPFSDMEGGGLTVDILPVVITC